MNSCSSTTDLRTIPSLCCGEKLRKPATLCLSTCRATRAGEHPLKSKWGYRLVNAIADVNLPVDSGDFKLLSRRAVNHLLQIEESRPYVRGLVSWIGFRQIPVFYNRGGHP